MALFFSLRRVVPALLLFLSLPAFAWAPLGHRVVGELASRHLTLTAQAEVARLLAGQPEPTLAGVANWADTLRQSDPDYFKRTSKWHYVNLTAPDCAYVPERDCKNGNCIIEAIRSQLAILRDPSKPLQARRDALKFVVHLVGDAHQPMHAGGRGDAGGNGFQVSLKTRLDPEAYAKASYVDGVMGTNLHAVWDYYILGEAGIRSREYVRMLEQRPWPPAATAIGTVDAWSGESCGLIDTWGIYPLDHKLDAAYGEAMRPLAERRLLQAGFRLAHVLNEALDPAYRAPTQP